jgi:hypothetical protein
MEGEVTPPFRLETGLSDDKKFEQLAEEARRLAHLQGLLLKTMRRDRAALKSAISTGDEDVVEESTGSGPRT